MRTGPGALRSIEPKRTAGLARPAKGSPTRGAGAKRLRGYIIGIKRTPPGQLKARRGFPHPKGTCRCANCTENAPKDWKKKRKKKIRIFCKKHLPNPRRCDKISLGCKRLVRYKSCRPAICVDAGGCRPAIAVAGYFRGVCPILEPGEKITDSDGIRSLGREVTPLRNGRNQCSDLIC